MTHKPRISIELCEDHDAQLDAGRAVVFHMRRYDVQVRRRRPLSRSVKLIWPTVDPAIRDGYIPQFEVSPDWTVNLEPGFGDSHISVEDARQAIEILTEAEENSPEGQRWTVALQEAREALNRFLPKPKCDFCKAFPGPCDCVLCGQYIPRTD